MTPRTVEKKTGINSEGDRTKQKKVVCSIHYILLSTDNTTGAKKASFSHEGDKYYPLLLKPVVRMADVKPDGQFMESNVKRKLARKDNKPFFKKSCWQWGLTNPVTRWLNTDFSHYMIWCDLRVLMILLMPTASTMPWTKTNTSNLSIYNRYVETEVDVEAITINDAMQVWKKDYTWNWLLDSHIVWLDHTDPT